MPALDLRYYTMYAHLAGGPTAIGPAGDGKVFSVMSFGENVAPEIGNKEAETWTAAFREKYPFDFSSAGFRTIFEYLQEATKKAGAVDATKIAFALEGLQHKDFIGYEPVMRKDDHQLISEYFVGVFKKGVKYECREDRARLGHRRDRAGQGFQRAHDLQDEAAGREVVRVSARRQGAEPWKSSSSRC